VKPDHVCPALYGPMDNLRLRRRMTMKTGNWPTLERQAQ
jgi:hypothetical protein